MVENRAGASQTWKRASVKNGQGTSQKEESGTTRGFGLKVYYLRFGVGAFAKFEFPNLLEF